LLLSDLGLLNDVPACTDLTSKPWIVESGDYVLNQAFFAKGNIAMACGCLGAVYLGAWVIAKLVGKAKAESAIHYVTPVGEKETTVVHCISVVSYYL